MKELNVEPVLDRIIIKQDDGEESIAGLIIPDGEKIKPQRGIVVAAGPGARTPSGDLIPMTSSVGDSVAYEVHAASEITIDDEEYVYIKECDLIIIDKTEKK